MLSLMVLLGVAFELLGPQALRLFIDSAIAGATRTRLAQIALAYILFVLIRLVALNYSRYLSQDIGWIATNRLRGDIFLHTLSLDLEFHKSHSSGEMLERVDGDITAATGFFSRFVSSVCTNLLLFLGLAAALFWLDWRLGLTLFAFCLIALYLLARMRRSNEEHWNLFRAREADFFGAVGEWLEGLEDIQANGLAGWVIRQFHSQLRAWYKVFWSAGNLRFVAQSLTVLLFTAGTALSLLWGAYLYVSGQVTLGTVYLIFTYAGMLRTPLERLRLIFYEFQVASASLSRVNSLRTSRTSLAEPGADAALAIPPGALSVEFDHVSFAYEQGDDVLKDVSFSVPSGKVLGILGRTGSGKTTIARLMFRLYDPSSGSVRIGHINARDVVRKDLRRRVAMVTQDVQVFRASVRDNLTFFQPGVADEKILEVLDTLGLSDWLSALPSGLDTEIDGGAAMSSGQAQLLAFARLCLSDPGLVVLDEPSSRLDRHTESVLDRCIDSILQDRTGIVIAHRLSTLARADYILIMSDGEVTEFGERKALLANETSLLSRLMALGLEEVLA